MAQTLPPSSMLELTKELAKQCVAMKGQPVVHDLVTSAPDLLKQALKKLSSAGPPVPTQQERGLTNLRFLNGDTDKT